MPAASLYSPLIPQNSAEFLRTNTCRYAEIHYYAFPQPTANYSLLTANSSYTFSAKERDSETFYGTKTC